MPEKFISNYELRQLLSKATDDERLALTKIVDKSQAKSYETKKLQKEICLFGGHGVANWIRESGTGYLDIVDDVAETLGIADRDSYASRVKYYDEIMYIKNERHDTPESKIKRLYDRDEARKLGNEYALKHEKKIIIKVMENAYSQMKKSKEKAEKELKTLISKKSEFERKIPANKSASYDLVNKLNGLRSELSKIQDSESAAYARLNDEVQSLEKNQNQLRKETKNLTTTLETLPKQINDKEAELKEAIQRLENFDNHLSQTISQYDSNSIGAITGTTGLMALANLGGFATYTFLTSMMSTLSFGTLGIGAYTAATSFLSIVIGPVGWTGLGLWTIFTLGKPDMAKLVLLVATIGMIRQRILYESNQRIPPNTKIKKKSNDYEKSKQEFHSEKTTTSGNVENNNARKIVHDNYVLVSQFAKEANVSYQDVREQIERGILRSKIIDGLLYVHIGDLNKIEMRAKKTIDIVRNVEETHSTALRQLHVDPSQVNTLTDRYRLIAVLVIVGFLIWALFLTARQPLKANPAEAPVSISPISKQVPKLYPTMHVTARGLNVREKPNVNTRVLGVYRQYQDVYIISSRKPGWAYVRAKGSLLEGYVSTKYLDEGSGESARLYRE